MLLGVSQPLCPLLFPATQIPLDVHDMQQLSSAVIDLAVYEYSPVQAQ